MDIQSAAINMSQSRLQEQAAMQVEAMSLSSMRDQSEALAKLLDSAAMVITDPNLGSAVDFSA